MLFLFLAFLWAAPSYLFLKKNKSRWLVATIQNKNVTQDGSKHRYHKYHEYHGPMGYEHQGPHRRKMDDIWVIHSIGIALA